jgi:hypothetical protein
LSIPTYLACAHCDDGWADNAFNGRAAARAKIDDHITNIRDELWRRGGFIHGKLRDLSQSVVMM